MSEAVLPLFYRDPRPLSSIEHSGWRLAEGDVSFAAGAPCSPIVVGEFVPAARHYPIVFAAADAAPIAVLGLEEANLFVTEGAWDADCYVPAYVRRYPFGFAKASADRFALMIDAASDRITRGGEAGVPLFEGGEPSVHTRKALAFCEAFHGDAAVTEAFANALRTQELLVERRADARLVDGRMMGLQGFQIVDEERFRGLPEAVVLDWHRRGWLMLVHHHLASLDRFENLLARQQRRTADPSVSQPERLDS